MFDNLTTRLQAIFKGLTGKGRLSEADVEAALREIRLALLEADVNFAVVKELVASIRPRAVGQEVAKSLTPGQSVIKIVLEELTSLLGSTESRLVLPSRVPNIIMLVGLQGSGKTTASAKLANHLRKQGRHPLLVACDIYRPAAIDQLEALGRELSIPVYRGEGSDAAKIAADGVKQAIATMRDLVIIDTAGRLHIDEEMMSEAARIKSTTRPDQVLMVVDSMTGQDAVNAARAFAERVDFDGVIISKLDGDARGGAALSVKAVTGRPVMFAGTGEKLDAFEVFYPDRMAKRILGMGDILSLIEKAQQTADTQDTHDLEQRLKAGQFTLEDFLEQLRQIKKMGGIASLLKLLPGSGKIKESIPDMDEKQLDRIAAIIQSMTAEERLKPQIIKGSRRARIAAGSGAAVSDVNKLLKQFAQTQKLVKGMGKGKKGGLGKFRF